MQQEVEVRVLYAYKNFADENSFDIIICDHDNPKVGAIVGQTRSTPTHHVFEISRKININEKLILQVYNISCIPLQDKFLISTKQYERVAREINPDGNNFRQQKQDSFNSSSQSDEESDGQQNSEQDSIYANKPMRNDSRYQHDSQNAKSQKKGRGRPKGSKNKKTIIKQEQSARSGNIEKIMHLHSILSGKIKRGKGRPKGSKNKPKIPKVFVKIQYQQNAPFIGKRGKGRPKGSKNKIKVSNQQKEQFSMSINNQIQSIFNNQEQQKIKRGRGRPPGAKNKPPSSSQDSEIKQQSESQERLEWERIDPQILDKIYCCNKCQQRKLRSQIFEGKKYFEDGIEMLDDPFCDFGLQNKKNLALQIIQQNDQDRLDLLLSYKESRELYFKPPIPVQNAIYRTRFQVKTKKQFLSQTGKEGIYVMFHDCDFKKEVWWKRIGIQRIIQNICNQEASKITIEKFLNESEEMKENIIINFPYILSTGNYTIAALILKDMLQSPTSNKFNYSQEHLDLLEGNLMKLNQYKKFKLIKPSDGPQYCSPIHCAAITPNPEFMQKLLQIFTDVINAQDSNLRKPIHYASACQNTANLRALVQKGAQLRQFDKKKMTPLMIACYYGVSLNVQYILEQVRQHSYINFRSDQGYSALHYAIIKNHEQCIDLLLNDPYIRYDSSDNKDQPDIFHTVAWTGNCVILDKLLQKWGGYLSNSYDKFKKTPVMYAIRNHNNNILYKLLVAGCRPYKSDSTLNTLLHYAAAYGNIEAIKMLLNNNIYQCKNKRNYYPWQLAVMKGHLGCAQLLQNQEFQFKHDPLYLLLTHIRGTQEYFSCINYVADQKFTKDIKYQQPTNGNTYLHLVCGLNQEQYLKQRVLQTFMSQQQIREEFARAQHYLISFFQQKGLSGYVQNKKKQSPLKQCIENVNLIGIQKLLSGKIIFDLQSAQGSTIMHRLSNLACKGSEQMDFVEAKLRQSSVNQLKINLKNFDQSGFDFLLYFVKNFTETIKDTFKRWVKINIKNDMNQRQAQQKAFEDFIEFQRKFMHLVSYLIQQGCDVNRQVTQKTADTNESYRKWGIQHFLMRFPSLKLIDFFINNKHKIRYFHAQTNLGMSPLHLFCKNIRAGNLLQTQQINIPDDYQADKILQYLLNAGLNPNTPDCDKSLPILYASLNHQYQFIRILLQYKSEINQVNSKNQVPLIQIIKNHKNYKIDEIKSLLQKGAKPSFQDMEKRNALHHLVRCSNNFDSSHQVCRLLLDYQVKINSLDKYNRSPLFYCFDPDDEESQQNDKVQLLQVLTKLDDINLNLLDVFSRSIVHYACRKNYFFSIIYLLDLNINIQIMDHQSNTPLAICLKERNLDQAALIIKKGVKYGFVNTKDKNFDSNSKLEKMSYFGYAIQNLSVGICFMLLDHGYPIQKALGEAPNEAFREILKKKYIK